MKAIPHTQHTLADRAPRGRARAIAIAAALAAAALTTGPAAGSASAASLSVSEPRVVEGNLGTRASLDFRVTYTRESLSDPASPTLPFVTLPIGSATRGVDYERLSANVSFSVPDSNLADSDPGNNAQTRTVSVRVIGDNVDEPNETVGGVLSGAGIGQAVGFGRITDDDATFTRPTPELPDLNPPPVKPVLPDVGPTLPGPPDPKP